MSVWTMIWTKIRVCFKRIGNMCDGKSKDKSENCMMNKCDGDLNVLSGT